MNGLKLAAAVRDPWPPIEIIILSAGRPPVLEDLSARAEFVPKPIIAERLVAKLRQMADQASERSH